MKNSSDELVEMKNNKANKKYTKMSCIMINVIYNFVIINNVQIRTKNVTNDDLNVGGVFVVCIFLAECYIEVPISVTIFRNMKC